MILPIVAFITIIIDIIIFLFCGITIYSNIFTPTTKIDFH